MHAQQTKDVCFRVGKISKFEGGDVPMAHY
jgi:hypothetical protein